ncbi:MAG: glycoside hydrolase family 19 protein [Gammaproteobacteria bacterium]
MISEAQVSELLAGNKNPGELTEIFNRVFPQYEITTGRRGAGFIAQCGHESRDFTRLEENLSYSAERLHEVFPKRFPSVESARPYDRKPEKIGNKIYGGRLGNGPESSGDGYKYRGRGAIQLTGHDNYEAFAKALGRPIDEAVAYCETLEGAVESACWYWKKHGLNAICDRDDIDQMTRTINGGKIGLKDRTERYEKAKKILPDALFA